VDFRLKDEQRLLVEGVREVASQYGLDYWSDCDRAHRYPKELWTALAEQGWLGVTIPEVYGGAGLGLLEAVLVIEEACRGGGGATLSQLFMTTPVFGGETVRLHGSDALKGDLLPGIARGTVDFCMALSEPDAGSDTMATRTTAVRDGSSYVVNGQKIWATAVPESDYILTIVRTAPMSEDRKRSHGLSLLVIETAADGVSFSPIEKLGTHTLSASIVNFENVRVDETRLVGIENDGWRHLLDTLNSERLVTAAGCLATADIALGCACDYARERVVFGRPIGANQAIQHPLAELKMELEAARLAMYKAAWLYDNSDDRKEVGGPANTAKYLAAEIGFRMCEQAMQTMGGYGFAVEYHVERLWRDVRLFRLAPVTQEMILNFMGQYVLELPRTY
jgi:acyl-CoA dehydrogenase